MNDLTRYFNKSIKATEPAVHDPTGLTAQTAPGVVSTVVTPRVCRHPIGVAVAALRRGAMGCRRWMLSRRPGDATWAVGRPLPAGYPVQSVRQSVAIIEGVELERLGPSSLGVYDGVGHDDVACPALCGRVGSAVRLYTCGLGGGSERDQPGSALGTPPGSRSGAEAPRRWEGKEASEETGVLFTSKIITPGCSG